MAVLRSFLLRETFPAFLMASAAGLLGLLLTLGLGALVGNFYQHQLEQRFAAVAGERAQDMQVGFQAHAADLDGVRRFFMNGDQVTQREFAGYVRGLTRWALSYAWVPRISHAERQAFEAAVRRDGIADFRVRQRAENGALIPAAVRDLYYPLLFNESEMVRDPRILGLDLAGLPGRLETLQRAERNGGVAASGVLRFVSRQAVEAAGEGGIILATPVYRAGERLQGFVIAAFSLRQLLHEQESGDAALNLSLELQDRSGLEGEALRYSSGSAADSPLQLQRELSLGDRRYSLLIRPTQAFIEANSTPILGTVLAAGTLLSLMLAALLFSLASQHQRARALVSQQTADLRQREAELAAVNSRLRGVLDAATQVAIIATDRRGIIQTFNVGAERMLGYRAVDLVGRHTPELIHLPEEIVQRGRELSQRLGRQIEDFEVFVAEASLAQGHVEQEWTYIRRDGSQLPVNLMVTGVRDAQDELVGFLGIAIDITASRQNRLALEARDRLLEKLTANVPGAIYQYQLRADGSSCFPYASAGIRTIYEVEPEVVREDAQPVFARIHPDDLDGLRRSILQSAEQLQPWQADYRVLLPRQGLRWLRGEASPEPQADGSVLWHGYLTDITGPKLVEQELRVLSITDALTGAYNRRYFQERLEAEISRARRTSAEGPAVVMLDIDHFKLVNDRFGHDVGDVVLKRVCERARQRLRTMDVLCRLGGEEFIVLAPGVRAEQAVVLAEALWQILREEPIEGAGAITASFGVTDWRAGESAASMLTRVDAAVYQAKQEGRDRVVIAP